MANDLSRIIRGLTFGDLSAIAKIEMPHGAGTTQLSVHYFYIFFLTLIEPIYVL